MLEKEGPQMTSQHGAYFFMLDKQGYTHAHAHEPGHPHARERAHTHTHTQICNTYCFSTARIVTRTLLHVTLYVHCVSCLLQLET